MIPTVDNYFVSRFKKILRAILTSVDDKGTEPYIIDEALHGYSKSVRDKFKKAYAIKNNKSALPIDVWFSYPDVTSQTKACYVVTRGSSSEDVDADGIGNFTGDTSEFGRSIVGENISTERSVLQKDEQGFYIPTAYPILSVIGIDNLDFASIDSDNTISGSNQIRLFSYVVSDNLIGTPMQVSYVIKDTGIHKDYNSTNIGYAMTEDIVISSLSDNADTTRELDSLLKFILIYMRDNGKESNYYQLPTIKSEPLGTPDIGGKADSNIYIINTTVTYKTTYQVSRDSATRIKDIIISNLMNRR
jgi:hypothetical protein